MPHSLQYVASEEACLTSCSLEVIAIDICESSDTAGNKHKHSSPPSSASSRGFARPQGFARSREAMPDHEALPDLARLCPRSVIVVVVGVVVVVVGVVGVVCC